MTKEEAVKKLDELGGERDSGEAHIDADLIILAWLQETAPEIAAAYHRVEQRVGGFWYD